MTISVIIPTYNRKSMVVDAITSVLNQTCKPHEIIVVDDGSDDGTDTLFPMEGVTYHKIKHSGFPGEVRNIGVGLSTGDYIAFLDSDDIWLEEKLEKQVSYFKDNPQCKILHTKERWIRDGKVISQKKRKHKRSGDLFKDSLQGCILGPSTVLMTRTLFNNFNGFNPSIEVGEDYDLWLRITDRESICYLDDELIVKHAGHGDQLSFKYGFIEPFKIEVLEDLILNYNLKSQNKLFAIEALENKYEIIINGCLKRGKEAEAQQYIDRRASYLTKVRS